MSDFTYRIHPTIGFGRVGTSDQYYLAPETMASLPTPEGGATTGGLPIKNGTESTPIDSDDIRDGHGALQRQAARFRIFQYPGGPAAYPSPDGAEITIGSTVDGKKVSDIIWTVHIANKKANWYELQETGDNQGIIGYETKNYPPIRNPDEGSDLDSASRLTKLVIDPGPRTVQGANGSVKCDKSSPASYYKSGAGVTALPDYPKSFPDDHFARMECLDGPIESLGELQTDGTGRLHVVAATGKACAWYNSEGKPYPLDGDVNNNGWFDDTGDGPVNAVIVFEDNSTQEVQFGAWVVTTDPGYAPQTLNAVSLWDDIYDSFVRNLDLIPGMYSAGNYNTAYTPSFADDVHPIFRAAEMQRWNTNLNTVGNGAHASIDKISATDDPVSTILGGLGFVRDPHDKSQRTDSRTMPLSLGDAYHSFLTLSFTQYFFLQQWDAKRCNKGSGPALGHGDYLDKASLINCLGGRFSPGIDMTFISRQPDLYHKDWSGSGAGPFRINPEPLDYGTAKSGQAFLSVGYIPLKTGPGSVQPGDISKFMSIPWHTDYNSCATHTPSPNPPQGNTLYWSWPAQRPVQIFAAKDVKDKALGKQRFSVRGPGTIPNPPDNEQQVGRYQERLDMITHWSKIGVVIQATQITSGGPYDPNTYLEVESQLQDDPEDYPVKVWPTTVAPGAAE